MAETGTPKGKMDLQYFALGVTIVVGLFGIFSYFEQRRTKKLAEQNALLEMEIKKIQLSKLKGQA